ACQFPRATACNWRNERPETKPVRAQRHRCKRNPGIVHRQPAIVPQQHMVPYEEAIPAGLLGFMGEFRDELGRKIVAQVGDADAIVHGALRLWSTASIRRSIVPAV